MAKVRISLSDHDYLTRYAREDDALPHCMGPRIAQAARGILDMLGDGPRQRRARGFDALKDLINETYDSRDVRNGEQWEYTVVIEGEECSIEVENTEARSIKRFRKLASFEKWCSQQPAPAE